VRTRSTVTELASALLLASVRAAVVAVEAAG